MSKPKSHLSVTLRTLMQRRNLVAADVHRMKPSLLNSFLSRILRGEQTSVSRKRLAMLAQCFPKTDAAKIIAAHCMDECQGPGADLIQIRVKGAPFTSKTV